MVSVLSGSLQNVSEVCLICNFGFTHLDLELSYRDILNGESALILKLSPTDQV
jgi:hypothetical protein